jgi:hypothetical protein
MMIHPVVRDLDFFKVHLFVLHNTDTVSFPLSNSRFLRYNKRKFPPLSDLSNSQILHVAHDFRDPVIIDSR